MLSEHQKYPAIPTANSQHIPIAPRQVCENFKDRLRHCDTLQRQVLTASEQTQVFLNIDSIYDVNRSLVEELRYIPPPINLSYHKPPYFPLLPFPPLVAYPATAPPSTHHTPAGSCAMTALTAYWGL